MYLLYHLSHDYDLMEHENIAVSKDRSKLEEIRERMLVPCRLFE